MRIIIFLVLLVQGTVCFSQNRDSLKRIYVNETIYRYGKVFMKGSDRLRFTDLGREFGMSNLGSATYLRARRNKNISVVLRVLSAAAGVAAISFAASGKFTPSFLSLGGQVVMAIGGNQYQQQSDRLVDKALWLRNKDLLFR